MALSVEDLRALALFEGCAAEDLIAVVDAVVGVRSVSAGEVVCAAGDEADRWWIVVDGLADVTVGGLYTATIGPGETIGELALLDGEPRAATVTAVTDMALHEVDGHKFVDVLLENPALSVALLRELAQRLRATNLRPTIAAAARAPGDLPDGAAPVTATPAARAAEFDPSVPGFVDDPAIHLAALRESAPVHWSEVISSYVVTRYDDVHRLLRDRALIGSITTMQAVPQPNPDGSLPRPAAGHRMMIRKDGDDHLRLRRLVSRVFTPRAVTEWQARAESIVERLLEAASERAEFDVMAEYALPLPAQVISEMLGMPHDDTPQLRAWSRALVRGLDPFSSPEEEAESTEAARAMSAYVEQVVADKRAQPADDILSALLRAEDAGDVLDDKEIVAQVLLLYIAGHETTLNLIGNGLTHLFRFPDQLERLRVEPDLDTNAIEEVLRFESPAQLTRRVNVEPLEVGDVTIPANSHVTLSLASANRDPRKWGPTADVLDIARPGANEHVSFGGGPHFCLGASLARLESRIALPRLVRRFPKLAPAYDAPDWIRRVTFRGVDALPVTLQR